MKRIIVITLSLLGLFVVASPRVHADDSGYYVKLYEDRNFQGRTMTLGFKENAPDLKVQGFNDKASSVRYNIPKGWKVVLHGDDGYHGSTYEIMEQGAVNLPDSFQDMCSSVQWIQY